MKIFSERLKELREERNWTMQDLAKDLKVSQPTITRWENGSQIPNIESLKQIAITFKVTTDYLVGLED